ncbi:hypothetical protein [Demequina sediminicola]|uniref:hypothetical protein n=1 Tax=Demequina sediminicola TaxID=1095026 RepID=UPI00128B3388|nr:hypothetical protein [Demequina sediminicola]
MTTWIATGRYPDRSWTPRPVFAVVAVLLATGVHVVCAWNAQFPVVDLDEIIMVGNSRTIAGEPGGWELFGPGFMPGLGVLMAPVWWFTDDPTTVYRWGIWIAVACCMAAIWPLSRVVRWVGATPTASMIIAAVVMMAPGRALISNYLFGESVLLLAVCLVLAQAIRFVRSGRTADIALAGVFVGAACLAHGRGVAIACAFGVWCLLLLRRMPVQALWGGAVAVLSSIGAFGLYLWVNAQLLVDDNRVSKVFSDRADVDWSNFLPGVIGQLWYPMLAWPAVVVAGLWLIASRVRGRHVAQLIALMTACGLLLSIWQINPAYVNFRLDNWYYGRYMEHMWTILAAIGLATLVRVRARVLVVAVLASTAAVAAAMWLYAGPAVPTDLLWNDLHVMGISPWLNIDAFVWGEPQDWGTLAALTVGLTLAVIVVAWFSTAVVLVLALFWSGLSVAHDQGAIDIRDADRSPDSDRLGVATLAPDQLIGIAEQIGQARNPVIYAAGSRPTIIVDIEEPPEGVELVYASALAGEPRADGAEIYSPSLQTLTVGWVYPGDLAEDFEMQGLLDNPSQ